MILRGARSVLVDCVRPFSEGGKRVYAFRRLSASFVETTQHHHVRCLTLCRSVDKTGACCVVWSCDSVTKNGWNRVSVD
jgi:hypothetical protein